MNCVWCELIPSIEHTMERYSQDLYMSYQSNPTKETIMWSRGLGEGNSMCALWQWSRQGEDEGSGKKSYSQKTILVNVDFKAYYIRIKLWLQ